MTILIPGAFVDLSAFSQVTSGGKAASDDTDGVERGEERGGEGESVLVKRASLPPRRQRAERTPLPPCSPEECVCHTVYTIRKGAKNSSDAKVNR